MRCSSLHEEGFFEAFAARFESSEPVLNGTDWSFSNPGYGTLEGGSEKSLSVNGKAETYKDFNPVGTITIEEE